MPNILAKVSKEELLSFARTVYNQALNGYSDLEDSVCIGETSTFFESLQKETFTYSDITFSSSIGLPINNQCFVTFDPQFSYNMNNQTYSGEEINLTEQQLLLFDRPDSSGDTINVIRDTEMENQSSQQIDSNEGHIFYNF